MERETGFEPATSTLARSHSTTELFPLGVKKTDLFYFISQGLSSTDSSIDDESLFNQTRIKHLCIMDRVQL